ncbi:MAG: hypothetical protein ABI968_09660 [Acidobacteriota bacterium]
MGSDLVSACIFCAGLLLGYDLSPRPGLSAEIGFSYATLARRYDVTATRADGSDATPKFLLVGLGNSWPAAGDLGAGTPASEWRIRVAVGPSHDEQERKEEGDIERVTSKGTGRYENFAGLARFSLGARDSFEIGGERRSHKATDLINIGGENQQFSEERSLTAEGVDLTAGVRHRWQGLEAAAAFRWSKNSGFNATADSFHHASGKLLGWQAEIRWQRDGWTTLARGQRVGGKMDVHRESFPVFADRDARLPGSLEAYELGVGYAWPRWELLASASYDRQHLPFVSLAVLGTETLAFDSGLDPDSLAKEYFYELTARYALSPAIRIRASVRFGWGSESVVLTDSAGVLPPQTLDVKRRGIFGGALSDPLGSPEPTLFLGADFAIGAPR